MGMVSTVLRAWCWIALPVSIVAAGGGQRGPRADVSNAGAPSANHAARGRSTPSPARRTGRTAIHARSSRVIPPLPSARRLSSRRLTPFVGGFFAGGGFGWWDEGWPSTADNVEEEAPEFAPAAATPVPQPRPAYAEPSSIQPLTPSAPARSNASSSGAGTLRFDVLPPNAQVYVDGFFAGAADALNDRGGLIASAGWHRLELRARGYQTAAVNVTIEPGRTAAFPLALRPLL
jgi:hypothetical protein